MKNNSQTRNYAEAMGQAMAFGASVTCCDLFSNTCAKGYFHGLRDHHEAQLDTSTAFTMDSYFMWRDFMYRAETIGHNRQQDPCSFGVVIIRIGNKVTFKVIRHHLFLEDALDAAEEEGTESCVWSTEHPDTAVYLDKHGRTPGTQHAT